MGGVVASEIGQARHRSASTSNALAWHVSYAMAASRAIFLDVKSDRYYSIETANNSLWNSVLSGRVPLRDAPDLQAVLHAQSALNLPMASNAYVEAASCSPISDSLLEKGLSRRPFNLRTAGKVLASFSQAKRVAKPGGLSETLRRLSEGQSQARRECDPAPIALDFHACRRIIPVKPVCLVDSLALAYFLSEARAPCELVFGIQGEPFRAHCWVQWDGVVLNDFVHRVRSFTIVRRCP
ncbi:lasso peptide biosynthesis B2 protein [Sphingomonas sp. SORGH_AS_0789]|uniref:lasso peptide biosynthesis B2 protein n=2 Tax=unclassified Sphingomonas TaxID=196159 RepID=UPI003867C662